MGCGGFVCVHMFVYIYVLLEENVVYVSRLSIMGWLHMCLRCAYSFICMYVYEDSILQHYTTIHLHESSTCPTYVPNILQDQQRIAGALGLLRTVVRKFEFKDESQRGPLNNIIQGTFPLLLQIMQVCMGGAV